MVKTDMGSAEQAETEGDMGGGGVVGGLDAGVLGGEVIGLDGAALIEVVAADSRPVLGTKGGG